MLVYVFKYYILIVSQLFRQGKEKLPFSWSFAIKPTENVSNRKSKLVAYHVTRLYVCRHFNP